MTDPSSILGALQSLKAASDIIKGLRNADLGFEKAELKLKISDLAEALASARLSILDAQEEILELRGRVSTLEAAEDVRDRLVMRDNVYFIKQDNPPDRGPFCPRCFEAEGKTMPVSELPPGFRDLSRYVCPNCNAQY